MRNSSGVSPGGGNRIGSNALLASPQQRLEQATTRVAFHFLQALACKADGTAASKWREPLPYSLEVRRWFSSS